MALDAAIADQLSLTGLAGSQNSQRLDDIVGKNVVQAGSTVMTLGVQLAHAAALKQLTSIDPMEAAAAANIRSSQDPSHIAGLQTASRSPGGTPGA